MTQPPYQPNPNPWQPSQPGWHQDPYQAPSPPAPKPSTFRQYWWVGLILASVLIIVIAFVYKVQNPSEPPEVAPPASTEPAATTEPPLPDTAPPDATDPPDDANNNPTIVPLNQPHQLDNAEVTITMVETGLSEWSDESTQDQFIVVHVKFTNLGKSPTSLSSSTARLFTADGVEHEPSSAFSFDRWNYKSLNPNSTFEGMLPFEVPDDASAERFYMCETNSSYDDTCGEFALI